MRFSKFKHSLCFYENNIENERSNTLKLQFDERRAGPPRCDRVVSDDTRRRLFNTHR